MECGIFLNLNANNAHKSRESNNRERTAATAGSNVGAAVNYRFVAAPRKGVFNQRSQF